MSDEISCVDLVRQQDELIQEAAALLPHKFDECSLTLKRQMIYSCLTCSSKHNTPIGVCYSCHINCHTCHDLLPLDIKTFTCDCVGYGCTLSTRSIPVASNKYNHNFTGKYCHCDSVYSPQDTMYQCLVCEDWFHDYCLDQPVIDDADEYICSNCVTSYNILKRYAGNPHFIFKTRINTTTTQGCPLLEPEILVDKTDLFLMEGWTLCKCDNCTDMLPKSLLEKQEIHQQDMDPKAGMNLYDLGLQELLKVDRTKALEGIYAYDSMKESLYKNLLIPCMEQGETVTLDRIREWIEKVKS